MEFSVNYSPLLGGLVREGLVDVERFKCPAWPDLLAEAAAIRPVYVHFPLLVGSGQGAPQDDEKKAPADLDRLADLLDSTGTPYVNTHLVASSADYPGIPPGSHAPRHIQQVVDGALRDLGPLVRRFGAERVLVENVINERGWLDLTALPEVLARVLDATGCGFLLDQSHARLSARNLGLDERAYTGALPVGRIREVHVTGLQVLEGALLEQLRAQGDRNGLAAVWGGKWIDHLPMLAADWGELAWLVERIRAGEWREPWTIAFEYGGVGGFWELVSEQGTYLEQVPRMEKLVKG